MRTLVVGTPRSGSTWVGSVLGMTADARYLHEPDDIDERPYVMKALRGSAGVPSLRPSDDAPAAYSRLWDAAFGGRVRSLPGQERLARALYRKTTADQRRAALDASDRHETFAIRMVAAVAVPLHLEPPPEHPVVKSVRLAFALEWVAARWQPSVVVCFRHPLDVVASALDLKWDARDELMMQLNRLAIRTRAAAYSAGLPDPSNLAACTAWWGYE